MKRVLATLLLSLLVLAPGLFAGPPKSIQPIQTAGGDNFCTAFSINEKQHYFATAAHCVTEEPNGDKPPTGYILGQKIEVVMVDKVADIAVVRQAFGIPALKIADKSPSVHDYVEIDGFPYGMPNLVVFKGEIASLNMAILEDDNSISHFAIFDCTAAPGNSGSPVLDKDHKVISILQVGWPSGRITGGATFGELKRVLQPYVE